MNNTPYTIVAVMGVAGSGKSQTAAVLAERLGWRFIEGDDLHPSGNVEKMRNGQALDDSDRQPWLERMHDALVEACRAGERVVLAASLLKAVYRQTVFAGIEAQVLLVYLQVDEAVLAQRLQQRQHFMPASLLPSQRACLEEPAMALCLDGELPTEKLVDRICHYLGASAS